MEQGQEHEQNGPIDIRLNGGISSTHYELNYAGLSILAVLILSLVTLFTFLYEPTPQLVSIEAAGIAATSTPEKDYFQNISLEGKAAFVWDVKNQKPLFALNEEAQLPLASITKLMTVAAASEYISPSDTVQIHNKNLTEEGDSGLLALEEWNVKDLVDFTLMVSSNDGANVLANAAGAAKLIRGGSEEDLSPEDAFVEEMNALAERIGLKQTYFLNETGLDPTKAVSGGYGSARDAALLMEYVMKTYPELLDSTTRETRDITSLSNFVHTATNTNLIIGDIPGLIASKTGFTDLAGGNLVVAFDAGINRPIIVSVLGSSVDGRFTDVEKLVRATLKQLEQ